MEAAIWLLTPLVVLLVLNAFSRAARRRRTLAQYQNLPRSAGYNPLAEMAEPAQRHVAQVNEHADTADDAGSGER